MLSKHADWLTHWGSFERVRPTARPPLYIRKNMVSTEILVRFLRYDLPLTFLQLNNRTPLDREMDRATQLGWFGVLRNVSRSLYSRPSLPIRELDDSLTVAYRPKWWWCEFYQLEIAANVGLVAHPAAVSDGHHRVFVCHQDAQSFCYTGEDFCCCTDPLNLQAMMAVWNASSASVIRETRRDGKPELAVVSTVQFDAGMWEVALATAPSWFENDWNWFGKVF